MIFYIILINNFQIDSDRSMVYYGYDNPTCTQNSNTTTQTQYPSCIADVDDDDLYVDSYDAYCSNSLTAGYLPGNAYFVKK